MVYWWHMKSWEQLFKMFGFTDSTSKLYAASLEIGPSSVIDLAKKINVSRMTAYTIIENLTKEGLMSTVQKGKKTLYSAESPEQLRLFMQRRMKSMQQSVKEMEDTIAELHLLQKGDRPVVKMFEGKEGFQTILQDLINSKSKKIYEIANVDAVKTMFSDQELASFKAELSSRGIQGRAIYSSQDPKIQPRKSAQLKIIKSKEIQFSGDVLIYENRVALMTFRGKVIGVLIESEELAQTMRAVFEMAWESELVDKETKK